MINNVNDEALEAGHRKIFIGGLSYGTNDEKLRRYFSTYGAVQDAVVMKDPISRRSRGFGFITFEDIASVDNALAQKEPHEIDSRKVEAKRAVPRSEVNRNESESSNSLHDRRGSHTSNHQNQNNLVNSSGNSSNNNSNTTGVMHANVGIASHASRDSLNSGSIVLDNTGINIGTVGTKPGENDAYAFNKIFVGGLHYDTRDAEFRNYFEKYGKVISAEVMFNRETHKSRGFGFIVFEIEESVDRVCAEEEHTIDKKVVEVKRAIPRSRLSSDSANNRARAGSQSSFNSNSMNMGMGLGLGPTPSGSVSSNSIMKSTTTTGGQRKSDGDATAVTGTGTTVAPAASGGAKSPIFSYAAALKAGASSQATPNQVVSTPVPTVPAKNSNSNSNAGAKTKEGNTAGKKDVSSLNTAITANSASSDTPAVRSASVVPDAPLSFASIAGGKSSKRNAQSPWTANIASGASTTTTTNTTANPTTTTDSSKSESETTKPLLSRIDGTTNSNKATNKGNKTTGLSDKNTPGDKTTPSAAATGNNSNTATSIGNKSNNNTNKDDATTESSTNMRVPQGQQLPMQVGNMQHGGQLSMEQMQANQLQLLLAQQNEVEGRLAMLESQGNTMENSTEVLNLRRYLSEVINMTQQMYALQSQMRGNRMSGMGLIDPNQMGHHGGPHSLSHSPPHAQNNHHQQRLPQWAGGMNGRGGYQSHHHHQHQNHPRMQGMIDMNSMSSPLDSDAWMSGMGGMIKPLDDYGTPSATGLGGDYGGGLQFGVGGSGQGQYGGMGYGVDMGSAWGASDRDGPAGAATINNGPQYPGSNVLFGKHSAGGSGLTSVGVSNVGQMTGSTGEYSNSMAAIRGSLMSQGGAAVGTVAGVAGGTSLGSDQDDVYGNVSMPPFFGDLSLGNPTSPPTAATATSSTSTAQKTGNNSGKK